MAGTLVRGHQPSNRYLSFSIQYRLSCERIIGLGGDLSVERFPPLHEARPSRPGRASTIGRVVVSLSGGPAKEFHRALIAGSL